jgi:hypothetical protein
MITISIILWIFSENHYFILLLWEVTLEKFVEKRYLMGFIGQNDYFSSITTAYVCFHLKKYYYLFITTSIFFDFSKSKKALGG